MVPVTAVTAVTAVARVGVMTARDGVIPGGLGVTVPDVPGSRGGAVVVMVVVGHGVILEDTIPL